MKAKYINPFTEFGFMKIFGEEASKPILLDFLNALLPQEASLKTYRDLKGIEKTNFEDGKIKGKIERNMEIAKQMKIEGFPIEIIIRLNQLTKAEIEKL